MTIEPVALVGMAVVAPGAPDLATYWTNLRDGVDAITDVPAGRHDPDYHRTGPGPVSAEYTRCGRGGFVENITVDAAGYGIPPTAVAEIEPDQLIALQVADAAITDAGGRAALGDPARIGVVLGRGGYLNPGMARIDQRVRTVREVVRAVGQLLPDLGTDELASLHGELVDRLGPTTPAGVSGLVPNFVASRVANRLDLRGPAYTVDAACASSLVAVDHAVRALLHGRCDSVLAGGVHHCHDEALWSVFTQLGALSPSERISPLAAGADGLLMGEATGIVVLRRLSDALRDGNRVYAVLRGVACSGDGRTTGLLNPESGGQVRAVRDAWASAGLDPREPGSVGLLEAHGTATVAGDTAEIATLTEVFGPRDGEPAVVGSVKSMIGHAMPAAGAVSLIKAALALHHRMLLPTLHCDEPNPALAGTRFAPIDRARNWDAPEGTVRRAAVNAFGFGGINAHVVLEEAPGARPVAVVSEPERVLRLRADTPDELARLLDRPDADVLTTATSASGRVRLGIVDPTERRLRTARTVVSRGSRFSGRGDIWFSPEPLLAEPGARTAFLFPGLEADFAPRVDDVAAHFGWPVPQRDDSGVLESSVGVMSVSRLLDRALRRIGVLPDGLAGHSVGEWTAMIVGGMYDLDDSAGPRAVVQAAWPDGIVMPDVDFLAVGCSAGHAQERVGTRSDVVVSHDNAPRQAIVCGPGPALAELAAEFRADRVVARILPFRSGYHTPMMAPLLEPFRRFAARKAFRAPRLPVWSATRTAPFPADMAEVTRIYLEHLVEPVRFRQMLLAMHADRYRVFVQVGPGQLGSFVGDTLDGEPHLSVAANSAARDGMAQLRRVATAVWTEGGEPDLDALAATSPGRPARVRTPVDVPLGVRPLTERPLTPLQRTARVPAAASRAGAGGVADLLRTLDDFDALLSRSAIATAPAPVRVPEPLPHAPPGPSTRTVRVSLTAMPWLRDHCFHAQRDGWPDDADRRPVVPATAVLDLAMRAAAEARPGHVVAGVRDAVFHRWLLAEPALDVELTLIPTEDGVAVQVGEFATVVVHTAAAYAPPEPAPAPPSPERRPALPLSDVYEGRRIMFHGPTYRGISALRGVGETHYRGEITVPGGPGGLLDNVGQLLACWLVESLELGTLAFPMRIASIAFTGPAPVPGSRVECLLLIRTLDDERIEMDAVVSVGGAVWARITGWRDVRMDGDQAMRQVFAHPDRVPLGVAQEGGWVLVHDRWPRSASRELYAGVYLASDERATLDAVAPRGRRHWLLGRMAAKDAVRRGTELFPAEIAVTNDDAGRPVVSGRHRRLPPVEVSIAHTGEVGVALAGAGPVGIDIAEVAEPAASTLAVALGPAEHDLYVDGGAEGPAVRFTRFWAAKEAVAKAVGTGFGGDPRRFRVLSATPQYGGDVRLVVAPPNGEPMEVHSRELDVGGRRYVVAWTDRREGERDD